MTLSLAVLISGGGSTLENLLKRSEADSLDARVDLVISSRADAGGLRYASDRNIASLVARPRDYAESIDFCNAVFDPIRADNIDLVVMAGYLAHLPIPPDFVDRVINIHPSLIPAFSGAGFYGIHVHEAVLKAGARISGCTVHFVDDHYDHGPIIEQTACLVADNDTPQSLQERVMQLERELLPFVINSIAAGDIYVDDSGRVARKYSAATVPRFVA